MEWVKKDLWGRAFTERKTCRIADETVAEDSTGIKDNSLLFNSVKKLKRLSYIRKGTLNLQGPTANFVNNVSPTHTCIF